MSEVANAQVAVFPTFKGFRSKVNQEVSTSGKAAGQSFQKAFQGAAVLSVDTSKLSRAVGTAGGALARTRLAQQSAAGKVRVAEAQLAEAIKKTGTQSARTVAAEEKLATANRILRVAEEKTEAATKDLTTAQKRLEEATKDTGQAGATAGKKYASGWAGVKQRIQSSTSSIFGGGRAERDAQRSGARSGSLFGGGVVGALGKAGIIGMVASAVVGPAVDGFNQVTTSASDLNETVNKSKSVFGGSFASVDKWSKGAAEGLGLSRSEALAAASGFGDMFTQIGATKGESAKMSKQVLQMSADLGSYNNLPTAEVSESIAAAFRGEYDSLQRVIPNINAARVEKQALAETGKKNAKSLTAEEKAHAVLAIVQKDGAKAMGDFAKTSGEVANKSKIMDARAADLSASFGDMLLPVKQVVLDGFGQLITVGEQVTAWLKANPEVVAGAEAAFSLLGDALGAIATVVWPILKVAFTGVLTSVGFIARSIAGFLELIGSIPGPDFQWARDASVKVNKVAAGIETLSEGINQVPDPKVDTGKSQREVDSLNTEIKSLKGKIVEAKAKGNKKELTKLQKDLKEAEKRKYTITATLKKAGTASWTTKVTGTAAGGVSVRIAAKGGAIRRKVGGYVPGWSPNDEADNIPAWLTAGEFVVRKRAARFWGPDFLDAVNEMRNPYAVGGQVATAASGSGSGAAVFHLYDADGVLMGAIRGEIAADRKHNRTVARMGAR